MKRREFITLVGGAAAAWPLAANAQQKGKLPLIGVLNPGSTDTPGAVGFYEGLRELGYTEGLNIAIERRYGDWNTDRFQQLAADLVSWSRLSEQNLCVDKWSLCRVRLPSGSAAG
jgi:putative ABC transport system substrate-binding protein